MKNIEDIVRDYVIILKNFVNKNFTFILVIMVIAFIVSTIIFYQAAKFFFKRKKVVEKYGNAIENKVLMFHVDWCPHCKKALPEWNLFKSEYNNKTIDSKKISVVDYDLTNSSDPNNKKLIEKYNIEGYPTVIFDKGGEFVELEVKVTKDNLVDFVKSNL
jgi:thiol-disulfide isomerase/thioredoxin